MPVAENDSRLNEEEDQARLSNLNESSSPCSLRPLPHPFKAPNKPKGKLTQEYLDALYTYNMRLTAIDLLRQKYQLSLHEVQGVLPEIVRQRRMAYDEHLERLKAIWRKEDEELAKKRAIHD